MCDKKVLIENCISFLNDLTDCYDIICRECPLEHNVIKQFNLDELITCKAHIRLFNDTTDLCSEELYEEERIFINKVIDKLSFGCIDEIEELLDD